MSMITIENRGGREIEGNSAISLLQLLHQAGIEIPTGCGGHARCGLCRITFINGLEKCSPPNRHEELYRKEHALPDNVRLACQTYLAGNAVIRIGGR